MSQEDFYKKLRQIADSVDNAQVEPQDSTSVAQPDPLPAKNNFGHRIGEYADAFTSGMQGGLHSFEKSLSQLGHTPFQSENKTAAFINALLGTAHTAFSPISGAFGVGSEVIQDVAGKHARDTFDSILNLPSTILSEGSQAIQKGAKSLGVDLSDKALGINPQTSEAGQEFMNLMATILGFKALHTGTNKAKSIASKDAKLNKEGKIDPREQKRLQKLAEKGKSNIDPFEDLRIIPKDQMEATKEKIKAN